jgi:hypothetical protein
MKKVGQKRIRHKCHYNKKTDIFKWFLVCEFISQKCLFHKKKNL